MKKIFLSVVVILIIAVISVFVYQVMQKNNVGGMLSENKEDKNNTEYVSNIDGDQREYLLEEFDISFTYQSGENGYQVEDITSEIKQETAIEVPNFLKAVRIMNTQEKREIEASSEVREGPPTINLFVFENTSNQSVAEWINENEFFSNINSVIGSIDTDVVVDGVDAVGYRSDGLYATQNIVIAHGGHVYHFTGAFIDENSDIYKDYQMLIDSVRFVSGN